RADGRTRQLVLDGRTGGQVAEIGTQQVAIGGGNRVGVGDVNREAIRSRSGQRIGRQRRGVLVQAGGVGRYQLAVGIDQRAFDQLLRLLLLDLHRDVGA